MQEIVQSSEGQRLFDFLDEHWGAIRESFAHVHHISRTKDIADTVHKYIHIEEESFDIESMEEGEFEGILEYFIRTGSSY